METVARLSRDGLDLLIAELARRGFAVVGPRVRDGAIVYDTVSGVRDLPEGITDEQAPGHYRLARRNDRALFGYTVGPQAWKQFLQPPRQLVFRAKREGRGFTIEDLAAPAPRFAFLGVRACELAAIGIQDRVYSGGPHVDAAYASRRAGAFVIAVQCGQAGGTCFCVSMNTGPRARQGFDLALTELVTPSRHDFLVEVGSQAGAEVLAAIAHDAADDADRAESDAITERVKTQMGRALETEGLPQALAANPEHPRWQEVASRCLTCANCTMVCPTCFCSTVDDTTDLSGDHAERWKRWDSCFTMDFTYMHGGSARATSTSRYRQWMTHKLSSWHEQFGTSGCVGCGRCISWCPVGIDITEEARAIAASKKGDAS